MLSATMSKMMQAGVYFPTSKASKLSSKASKLSSKAIEHLRAKSLGGCILGPPAQALHQYLYCCTSKASLTYKSTNHDAAPFLAHLLLIGQPPHGGACPSIGSVYLLFWYKNTCSTGAKMLHFTCASSGALECARIDESCGACSVRI